MEAASHALHAPGGWLALLRFEWAKLTGRRITWVPFLVIALVVALLVIVYHHAEFKYQKELFFKAMNFKNKREFVNGYFMTAYAMNPIFQMLIPIFITVASGMMVAGEYDQGTLRACLIRPVSRNRLILVKFGVLCIYALALVLFSVVLLTATGIANFSSGNLYAVNLLFNNGQEGVSTIPEAEVPMRLISAWLLASIGMMVLSALALLISSLVESAAMAYVISLSVYFSFMTLRAFPFLEWLHPYLFVTHMLSWQQSFFSYMRTGEILVSLIHQLGYLVSFLCATLFLFKERDIKS